MATGKEASTEQTAKVRSVSNPNRVLAEGTDDDAFAYVERNFPRIHSEEAGPDVEVTTVDGAKHQFINGEWETQAATKKEAPK